MAWLPHILFKTNDSGLERPGNQYYMMWSISIKITICS